ncbi:serine carboxypeptidase S28-domain-containing protein [Cristinia sonorae]|uniref:Serine carboxypeptidase S28-domain-containing protein n=1 Tax=Cristinia sonorae TaxID=1940300 RepID=A0A8K0XQE9_9AGAR|nr:serine carboxypeptidase S28-domain-containing protein [Cristinia sonorae]
MAWKYSLFAVSLALASSASNLVIPGWSVTGMDLGLEDAKVSVSAVDFTGAPIPPVDTIYYFDQLIDHNNPQLGTFKQRYWHYWEFYKPGGPIILATPGEADASAGAYTYVTNKSIFGQVAEQEHGATIILEHRYYGQSNPVPDLSAENMRYNTLPQAINDLEYFAKNVKLPMPGGDNVKPGQVPWVLMGGSYSGALTAWTMIEKPGLFAAGYASSAVVQAITDFWQYFEPIRVHMPQNCSADVQAVIAHFDQVFASGNTAAIDALKSSYGMAELTHLDDVVAACAIRSTLGQRLSPTSGPSAGFWEFCDALEVKDGVNAPVTGWGLDHALAAWGKYFSETFLADYCDGQSIPECLGTYEPSLTGFANTTIPNTGRSWFYMVCNEVGWLQTGAPSGHPTIVSRLITTAYEQQLCQRAFPGAFPNIGSSMDIGVARTNDAYHGWNVQLDRFFFANGKRDPWLDATVSATGLNVPSTDRQRIVVSEGFHCNDLLTANGAEPSIKELHKLALSDMKRWLAEYREENRIRTDGDVDEKLGVSRTIRGVLHTGNVLVDDEGD